MDATKEPKLKPQHTDWSSIPVEVLEEGIERQMMIGLTPKVSGGFEKVTKEPEVACRFLEFDTEPLGDDPFGKLKP